MRFSEFGFDEQLLEAISYLGFENATPIQERAIPEILNGKDLIACAQTGTGKTAAFMLPVLHNLITNEQKGTDTLVIVPTRELAIQIDQQVHGYSYFSSIHSIAIYGGGDGSDWGQQKTALTSGADIVIATPGKLISHLNMGYVKFDKVKHLVLDEADRMLDIGFFDDIVKIIDFLPKERQTLMFSATMPPAIRKLAKMILKDPIEIHTEISKPPEGVLQLAYLSFNNQKVQLINSLIGNKKDLDSILIFCSTKKMVAEITRTLKKSKIKAESISSDLEQQERESVLMRFRARQTRVLVATDVLSRGIDIKDINLVINYDAPSDAEDYVHRVGRTARASSTGIALTLVNPDDMFKLKRIEELIGQEIKKLPVPAELGESPEWKVYPPSRDKRYGKKGGRKYEPGKKRFKRNTTKK